MTTYDAKEIGYAFLRTYYERMHNDPSKLSCLYSTTAELTHINYNEPIEHTKDYLNTVKLMGKDNINNFFTRNSKRVQDLKVKIDSCDFQSTGYESSAILILTLGELCWTNSPSYRFFQCFVLEPADQNNTIFDLKNDIIRFIPEMKPLVKPIFNERHASTEKKKQEKKEDKKTLDSKKESKTKEKVVIDSTTINLSQAPSITTKSIENSIASSVGSEKENCTSSKQPSSNSKRIEENAEEKIVQKMTPKSSPKGDVEITTGANSTEISTSSIEVVRNDTKLKDKSLAQESVGSSMQGPSQESSTKPDAVKMTWAGKLNKTSKLTTNYIKVDVPQKKAKSPPPNGFTKSNKKSKQQSKTGGEIIVQNSSGFYPVYVGNTNGLTANELEKTLSKEYGEIVKTSFQDSFAVVDFREKAARDAALEAQHIRVGERTINLNPKEERGSKYNKSKNNSGGNGNNSGTSSPPLNSGVVSSTQNNLSYKKSSSIKSKGDKIKN